MSDFYREEFLRHLNHLEHPGAADDGSLVAVDRACRRFLTGLDRLCWRAEFPAVAETLLQNFETLTRLSELDRRQGH